MKLQTKFGVDKGFKVRLWFDNCDACLTGEKLPIIAHNSCGNGMTKFIRGLSNRRGEKCYSLMQRNNILMLWHMLAYCAHDSCEKWHGKIFSRFIRLEVEEIL